MRSGSRTSRYFASRSCACFSGPPVRRTAPRGSGRAMSGTALVMRWAPDCEGSAARNSVSVSSAIGSVARENVYGMTSFPGEYYHGGRSVAEVQSSAKILPCQPVHLRYQIAASVIAAFADQRQRLPCQRQLGWSRDAQQRAKVHQIL